MANTIAIIILFWLILSIPGWLTGRRRDKKISKIRKQQVSDRHDFELEKLRVRQEFKLQQEREKEQNRQLAALAKEQQKLEREQERQRKAIARATFTAQQAQQDIDHLMAKIDELQERDEFLRQQQSMCLPNGKEWWKWQDKISANDDKISRLEKQMNKAYFQKQQAEEEIA